MSEIKENIRYLSKAERYLIKGLYLESFDDPIDYVEYYCNQYDADTVVCIDERTKNVLSMINIHIKYLEYNNKIEKAAYLYGVATKEGYKRKGYMKKLMNFVINDLKTQGINLIYLIPDVSQEIYEKCGFTLIREKSFIYVIKDRNKIKYIEDISLENIIILERNFDNTDKMKMYMSDNLRENEAIKYKVFPIMIHSNYALNSALNSDLDNALNSATQSNSNNDSKIVSLDELDIYEMFSGFINNEDV